MLLGLFILAALAAIWWGLQLVMPAQRRLRRFAYSSGMLPDRLNGGFPGDDVTASYGGDPPAWPSVTVIVPGRNEGHILERTLGSLCAMEYPNYRVVFVDDQSTDNTAEVCRELERRHGHLTVIRNQEMPRDGWIGKTWAVHQAEPYMHDSDYLLFTDSDLEFHPQCLRHMMRLALHRRTDITSLLPSIYYESTGELLGLLAAMCLINARLSLYVCNNPKVPRALVAGGFLLVKREVYHALGGHAAVRGQVVEDVAFGTRAKVLGKRVFTAVTHDLYRARMYEGWGDTYRGLKKNAYAGANYHPGFALFILAFLLLVGTLPVVYAVVGAAWWLVTPGPWTLAAALAGVAAAGLQWLAIVQTARFVGFRTWVAFLAGPSFAFYLAVFVGSVVDYYRGGNLWAGRRMERTEALSAAGKVG